MSDHASEPGLEVVLDNRKLIIAFAVLIAFCGCFFVVGFIEGKRQGYQEGAQVAAESASGAAAAGMQAQTESLTDSNRPVEPVKEDVAEQPLDWYKNVNRRDGEPKSAPRITPPPPSKTEPAKTAAAGSEPPLPPAKAAPVTYSVQVGAFSRQSESEIRARELQSKGFDCRIEAPESPGELYLIKVGRYKSRADAVAMQLRLKKSGFTSFIKTN